MLISAMHEGGRLLQDPSSLASRCKQKIGQSWPHCWQGLETFVSILNGPILLINLYLYTYIFSFFLSPTYSLYDFCQADQFSWPGLKHVMHRLDEALPGLLQFPNIVQKNI